MTFDQVEARVEQLKVNLQENLNSLFYHVLMSKNGHQIKRGLVVLRMICKRYFDEIKNQLNVLTLEQLSEAECAKKDFSSPESLPKQLLSKEHTGLSDCQPIVAVNQAERVAAIDKFAHAKLEQIGAQFHELLTCLRDVNQLYKKMTLLKLLQEAERRMSLTHNYRHLCLSMWFIKQDSVKTNGQSKPIF